MIVGSLLLILVAVVLLVAGLVGGSSFLLVASIAASLLAAVALVVGARQAATARATADQSGGGPVGRTGERVRQAEAPHPAEPTVAVQFVGATVDAGGNGWRQPADPPSTGPRTPADPGSTPTGVTSATADDDRVPPDAEPGAQVVSPDDAARVAGLDGEVLVVDGRPRYHLADCVHLIGHEPEPLPVSEAVELGFTPCADCAPDTALLAADARSS